MATLLKRQGNKSLTLLPEFQSKAIRCTLGFFSLIHSSFDDLSVLLKKSLFQTCVYPDKICDDHLLSIGLSLDIQKKLLITSSSFECTIATGLLF